MNKVPIDFSPFSVYLNAATAVESYSSIAAITLRHVFADKCSEKSDSELDPESKEFLDFFKSKLPPFPIDGPDETQYVADELYATLIEKLQSGEIYKAMPDQLWLCATLYSVIEGQTPVIREKNCKIAAAKLHQLFNKVKPPPPPAPKIENDKISKESKIDIGNEVINENITAQSARAPQDVPEVDAKLDYVDQPNVLGSYNVEHVRQYLEYIGAAIPDKAPNYSKVQSLIQRFLDLGNISLQKGDKRQAYNFFKKAYNAWRTNKDA